MPKEGPFVFKEFKWSQKLASFTPSTIKWYKRDFETKGIILSCGDFTNVPLMVTRGCIKYNHVLSMTQLGYIMDGPPYDDLIEEFILHDIWETNPIMKKVQRD